MQVESTRLWDRPLKSPVAMNSRAISNLALEVAEMGLAKGESSIDEQVATSSLRKSRNSSSSPREGGERRGWQQLRRMSVVDDNDDDDARGLSGILACHLQNKIPSDNPRRWIADGAPRGGGLVDHDASRDDSSWQDLRL
ncbi:hypothetical protein NL676_021125 [Syzygium grande]|nr:hypothetical protein NL676_021125 [Syzygium grande]